MGLIKGKIKYSILFYSIENVITAQNSLKFGDVF